MLLTCINTGIYTTTHESDAAYRRVAVERTYVITAANVTAARFVNVIMG